MSHYVSSTRCPRCAKNGGDKSGNNLAVYSDGHEWCYACGYLKPAAELDKFLESQRPKKENTKWFTRSPHFNQQGISWLKSYGLTNDEIDTNYFWDETGYCVFNGGQYENARNFSGAGPKYITKGNVKGNEMLFVNVDTSDSELLLSSIVIVEDAISAIKIARVCSAMPIHNAVIPLEAILRLSRQYKNLFIWLDNDKSKEMLGEAEKAKPYFDKVKVVYSDKDPKCYTNQEIKEKLCSN